MSDKTTKNFNFENLYQAGFEAIFISIDGICLGQNIAAEKLFGYSFEEAVGSSALDWIEKSYHQTVSSKISKSDENPYEVDAIRKDGSCFPVEIRAKMLQQNGQTLRVTSILDISDRRKAEEKLNQGEMLLDAIFDASPDLFFLIDSAGIILEYKARRETSLYVQPETFLGQRMQDVLPSEVAGQFDKYINQSVEQKCLTSFEYRLDKDGVKRFFEARISAVPHRDQLIVIVRDISAERFAETEIRRSEIRYRSIFDSSVVSVVVTNRKHNIVEWNEGSHRIFGYTFAEATQLKSVELVPKRLRTEYQNSFIKNDSINFPFEKNIVHESLGLRKNGEEFPIALTISSWYQEGELFINGMILDISKRKKAEKALAYHAHFDALTELPNRFLALDRLNQLVTEAKRSHKKIAVLHLDIDGFKKVNESFSRQIGDRLLIGVSERLTEIVGNDHTVARFDGDKFVVFLSSLNNIVDARTTIQRIIAGFRESYFIENRELLLTVSIGVAVYPFDGRNSTDLIKNAESATLYAKQDGGNLYSYFTQSMNIEVARRLSVEEQIHGALERKEFEVFYQAQRDTFTNEILGAEALLRWNNPVLGFVSPDEFIPLAEQSGLIGKLGIFVLEQAMSQLAIWRRQYKNTLKIAVNLSPMQFRDRNLVKKISDLLETYQLDANGLGLEITEGVLMGEHSYIEDSLKSLVKLGVCIAMDDFGTGFSSLSYLRKFPFDVLKIDRSFVRDILTDKADKELINATIVMSHALGLKVVAEGVDTNEQLEVLKTLNCDYVQGFLFGKPANAADFVLQLGNK